MQRTLIALLAAASITSLASAQGALSVRVWDGSAWSTTVNSSGGLVHCAVFISFGTGHGLGGAVYNIQGSGIVGDSVDLASPGLGRQTNFDFGANSQSVFTSAGAFRIDNANDAANDADIGISTAQEAPAFAGSSFNTANPALVYKFDVNVNANAGPRSIDLSVPINQLKHGSIAIYATAQSSASTPITGVTTSGASISVQVPAPASLAILGLTGLIARRRR